MTKLYKDFENIGTNKLGDIDHVMTITSLLECKFQ